jgi:hypothetical protein
MISSLCMHIYFSNCLLIPIAVGLFLLTSHGISPKERSLCTFFYFLFLALLLLPSTLLVLTIMSKQEVTSMRYLYFNQRGISVYFVGVIERCFLYFTVASSAMSWPWVLGGLVGMVMMAARKFQRMPLIAWLVHFALWILIPGFTFNGSPTWHRTFPYIIPIFAVGVTYLLFELAKLTKNINGQKAIIAAAIILHLIWNIPIINKMENLAIQIPSFYASYFESRGKLRTAIVQLSRKFNTDDVILCWTYWGVHYFEALTDHSFGSYLPALSSLEIRQKHGTLADYVQKTNLSVTEEKPVYFLLDSEDHIPTATVPTEIQLALSEVLGPNGLSWFKSVNFMIDPKSETITIPNRELKLYKLSRSSSKP